MCQFTALTKQKPPKTEVLSGMMVAEEGFEPSQTESESVVLPLHNSAICFLLYFLESAYFIIRMFHGNVK